MSLRMKMKLASISILVSAMVIMTCLVANAKDVSKCAFPMGTRGVVMYNNIMIPFTLAKDINITILEVVVTEEVDENGKKTNFYIYRFSATYDKPVVTCANHGSHTFEEYFDKLPKGSLEYFHISNEDGSPCK